MSIEHIPLSDLNATSINARRTGGASIDDLAASISHHGLFHNLVVTKGTKVGAGLGGYLVVAGGRRLKALAKLQAEGALPASLASGIPCLVVEREHAEEASLAENVIRQDMHPADEFDAFKAIVDDGHSIGEVAARFGKPEIYVKQRLKLANVAPEILDEYRADKATLEQMMALALTDDQAMQSRIWKGAKTEWQREPRRLREAITEKEFSTESRLGKFIGLAAYEKAGGSVRRDMFADGGEAFMQDAELVARLCTEKLERSAAKLLKDGWLWAEGRHKFDYTDERAFGTVYPSYKGGKSTWTDEIKATAGAIVTIGHHGETEIKRGLVRAQDRKAAATATGGEAIKGGKKLSVPGELSFAAIQRLQAEATGILQAEIAELPRTALALLAAELAGRALYKNAGYANYANTTEQRQWVHIQRESSGRMPGNLRDVIPQSAAGKRFAETEKAWKERVPKKKADLREWVLAQDFDTIAKMLAFLSARELDLVDFVAAQKQGAVDLAAAAQVDLSQHWAPSVEWLATLPKSVIVAMVTDAAGKVAAAPLTKMKRDQLPKAAIALLPKGWLPKPLRPKAPAKAATKKPAAKKPAKPARAAKVKQ